MIQTTEKDLRDITAVLVDHDFTTDETGVNLDYLSALTSADWGLWKTVQTVVKRARQFASEPTSLRPRRSGRPADGSARAVAEVAQVGGPRTPR